MGIRHFATRLALALGVLVLIAGAMSLARRIVPDPWFGMGLFSILLIAAILYDRSRP
jgi:hypothetical protein